MPLSSKLNRRHFLQASAVAAGLTFDTLPLQGPDGSGRDPPNRKPASGELPTGRIGKLEVTRLICGGNLFSGFAHSGETALRGQRAAALLHRRQDHGHAAIVRGEWGQYHHSALR